MYKIFIVLILAFTGGNLCAQKASETSNLFAYGEQVLSCEDNLKNLFRNFSLYIENADAVRLSEYKFAGIVKNRKQAVKYAKRNCKAPAWNILYSEDTNMSSIRLGSEHPKDKDALCRNADGYADEFIKIGYHVYAIKFFFEMKTHTYYVFINPENKQVVTYGNIWGFDIPIKHFVLHKT